MGLEKLSAEDQELINTDFGEDLEKEAAARVALAQEMYETGFSKLAAATADELDKLAEEEEKKEDKEDDDKMDEESEKAAAELGAFIERGFIDGLKKLGSDRHGNEWHYLMPFVEEKVAAAGTMAALKNFGGKMRQFAQGAAAGAKGQGKKMVGAVKAHGKGIADDAKKAVTGKNGKQNLSAGARGAAAGRAATKVSPYLAAAGVGAGAAALGSKKKDGQ